MAAWLLGQAREQRSPGLVNQGRTTAGKVHFYDSSQVSCGHSAHVLPDWAEGSLAVAVQAGGGSHGPGQGELCAGTDSPGAAGQDLSAWG